MPEMKKVEMGCREFKEYLYPFLDGELDSPISHLVKDHLSACPICRLELEQEKKINSLIKDSIPKEKAPYELKEEILKRIEGYSGKRISRFILPVLKPALIGIIGTVLIFVLLSSFNRQFTVYSETVKEHIQFLQGNLPMHIVSKKPQDVSKWLQSKLDFKIMVPDLSSQNVNLLGARLCSLKNKKSAYIMYEKGGHNISVFMFDAKNLKFPKAKKVPINKKIFYLTKDRGYNSALWIDEGIACVFISDLSEVELLHLASL